MISLVSLVSVLLVLTLAVLVRVWWCSRRNSHLEDDSSDHQTQADEGVISSPSADDDSTEGNQIGVTSLSCGLALSQPSHRKSQDSSRCVGHSPDVLSSIGN